jgi:hypothetical protein
MGGCARVLSCGVSVHTRIAMSTISHTRPHRQRQQLLSHPRPLKPLEDPDEQLNQSKPSQNQQIHDSTVHVTLRQLLL